MKINFPSGSGWIYLDPLAACENDILRFEFITAEADGLLLYNGPMDGVDAANVPDFISIELLSGQLRLRIDLGDGEVVLPPSDTTGPALNDGNWHTVEVFRSGTVGNGTVAFCQFGPQT